MSEIVHQVKFAADKILTHGDLLPNGTKELINYRFAFPLKGRDFGKEYDGVNAFFHRIGLKLASKWEEEKFHYGFLQNGLLHKIRATKYFHKEGLDSRKIIIFSEDCISMLQWMSRPSLDRNIFNVYIRSSDALGLLAVDLLALLQLYQRITEEHPQIANYQTSMEVTVASCHIYCDPKGIYPTTRDGTPVKLEP